MRLGHLPSGTRVGRYEVVGVLGEGGMGVVYRARDPTLEREVALKLLAPGALRDPEARAGLLEEARRIARLDHPHVGVIHEVGDDEGVGVYLAMALHEGETLADRLRRGPLPLLPAEVLRVARGVGAALQAAHEAGIVHRDVKPSNVHLTGRGDVRLLDFGIAAGMGEISALRGSPGYVPPEVLAGAPADASADLWGLGVLLHEMVTEVRPPNSLESPTAPGDSVALGSLPALDAREANGGLPPGLAGAIRACLAPDPADRPEGAGAVLEMLGEPSAAPSPARAPEPLDPPEADASPGTGGWSRTVLVAGMLGLAALIVIFPRGNAGDGGESASEASGPGDPAGRNVPRVLVLPFEDRTGDAVLERVGSMAADWITEGIVGSGIANVVDATSALVAVRETRDPVALASRYRADLVVTGAYYLDRDSLRLAARIVDGVQGTVVRALDPAALPREDPLGGIDPLRQALLVAVSLQVDPRISLHERLATARPPPWDAYVAYLRGKEDFLEARWQEARERWIEAEALAPDFYPAIFFGAVASANLGDLADMEARRDRLVPHAARLTRPTQLGLESVEAFLAGDLEAGYRNIRRGVDEGILAPGTLGHAQLVFEASALGRFKEAIEAARASDPMRGEIRRWSTYWSSLALSHHALGDFHEELQVARRAREALGPGRIEPVLLEVRALAALGEVSGVDAVVDEGLRLHSDPAGFLRVSANHLLVHGHEEEAMRRYRESVVRARQDLAREPGPAREMALVLALLELAEGGRGRLPSKHIGAFWISTPPGRRTLRPLQGSDGLPCSSATRWRPGIGWISWGRWTRGANGVPTTTWKRRSRLRWGMWSEWWGRSRAPRAADRLFTRGYGKTPW